MEMLTYLSTRRDGTDTDPLERDCPMKMLMTYLSTRRDGTDTDPLERDCPMEVLTDCPLIVTEIAGDWPSGTHPVQMLN